MTILKGPCRRMVKLDFYPIPASETNGVLRIIIENNTVKGEVDDDNNLNLMNETFKKLDGKYSNPGAGVY